MIADAHSNQRAIVDEHGNVIIPPSVSPTSETMHVQVSEMKEGQWYAPEVSARNVDAWEITEHDRREVFIPLREAFTGVAQHVRSSTEELMQESARQYLSTFQDTQVVGKGIMETMHGGLLAFWKFLTQPVWVPGKRAPKQYSRGMLFTLDIVRFGGTFASLFLVLFFSLNYQSFWAIAQSYVSPLADITQGKTLEQEMKQEQSLTDTLTGTGNDGSSTDLAMLLPPVGPPEKRLIVPKLDLNVPIVTPPTDELIKEDWKGLESDIQKGLEDGVVHYPGTARPGQAGNFFVTGHSSYYYKGTYTSVFARLYQLDVGDEYWVYYGGDKFRYVVKEKKEINPSDVSVLDQPLHQRISTLMTCTPVGTTLRRLVIIAQEVDPVTGKPMEIGEHAKEDLPKMKLEALPI